MNQTIEAEDCEISLLDLLQVVADNLRLLVLGPLAAGLQAWVHWVVWRVPLVASKIPPINT